MPLTNAPLTNAFSELLSSNALLRSPRGFVTEVFDALLDDDETRDLEQRLIKRIRDRKQEAKKREK
jgi:hypothetical protein